MSAVFAIREWLNFPVSSEALMLRYAEDGDERVLALLYDRSASDLYHFLLVLTDKDTAMDIAQKTWLKVIEKRHLYRQSGRFEAWLFTLARNALIDDVRYNQRFVADASVDHIAYRNTASPLQDALPQALSTLPFDQREAFCLHQEGFGIQEISMMCSENTETIKSRIRYAKQKLQKLLERHHD